MIKRYFILAALIGCHQLEAAESMADPKPASLATIAALIADALDNNPGIQSIQASLDAATAREQASNKPLYNPELEFEAENVVDQSASAGISQTFDWRNKQGARGGIASSEREAATAEVHRRRQKLAIELLDAITRFDVANRLLDLSDERERLMRQFAALATQRKVSGDLNQVEFDLAQLALAEARLQRAETAIRLSEVKQALSAVLGEKEPSLPPLPDAPHDAATPAPDIEQILRELPIMRVQLARIAVAKGIVKLRALEKHPDPTVGVRVGQEESEMLAGVRLSIPWYIRNNYKAEVEVANAELIQVELEAQDIHRRSRALLVASLERYRLAESAWANWMETGQQNLGNQLNVLDQLWRAGELSTSDYLVQVNQTLDTRTAAAELHGRVWLSWFEWLSASGRVELWLASMAAPKKSP